MDLLAKYVVFYIVLNVVNGNFNSQVMEIQCVLMNIKQNGFQKFQIVQINVVKMIVYLLMDLYVLLKIVAFNYADLALN